MKDKIAEVINQKFTENLTYTYGWTPELAQAILDLIAKEIDSLTEVFTMYEGKVLSPKEKEMILYNRALKDIKHKLEVE